MGYFIDSMRGWSDFSGRADRTDYWMFMLVYVGLTILLAIIDVTITGGAILTLFYLITLIPFSSITARRLHDTGRTGWWQLVAFIPGIGGLILIFLPVLESSDLNNPYD